MVRKVFGNFLVFWFCLSILITIASCSCAGNNNWDKQNHFCIHTIRLQTIARKGFLFYHSKAIIQFKTLLEFLLELFFFLDAQASLAPTHVCLSVGNTFEFPFYQSLWLLYVKSWRKRTPIIFQFWIQVGFVLNFFSFSLTFSIFP